MTDRIAALERTVATLVSSNLPVSNWTENYVVHERLWDHVSRLDARMESLVARLERTIGAVNDWKVELAKEVESFRRLVVDLRKHTDASDLVLHGRIDTVQETIADLRDEAGP